MRSAIAAVAVAALAGTAACAGAPVRGQGELAQGEESPGVRGTLGSGPIADWVAAHQVHVEEANLALAGSEGHRVRYESRSPVGDVHSVPIQTLAVEMEEARVVELEARVHAADSSESEALFRFLQEICEPLGGADVYADSPLGTPPADRAGMWDPVITSHGECEGVAGVVRVELDLTSRATSETVDTDLVLRLEEQATP